MIARAKKFGVRLLVALLVFAMAAFGLQNFILGSPEAAMEINGEKIYQGQIDTSINNYRVTLANAYGEDFVSSLSPQQISNEARQQLVQQVLLRQSAKKLKLSASDQMVNDYLLRLPQLRIDGVFSVDALNGYLVSNRLNLAQLQDNLRVSIGRDLLLRGFSGSQGFPVAELDQAAGALFASRDILAMRLPHSNFANTAPDGQQLQAFFVDNSTDYIVPPAGVFTYLLLTRQDFVDADDSRPSEQQLELAYQGHLAELKNSSIYAVAHILVTVDSRSDDEALAMAKELRQRIDEGEDFATLAEEYSEDPGSAKEGGKLGRLGLNSLVPEFADQVRLMQPGDISPPVRSDFGYHLIKLISDPESQAPGFDELRDELVDQLRQQQGQQAYSRQLTRLDNLVAGVSDIAGAADTLGLTLHTSARLQQYDQLDDSSDLFANPEVIAAAFSPEVIDQGLVRLIRLDDKAVALARSSYTPERQQSLEEVRDLVREQLINELAREAAMAVADRLVELDLDDKSPDSYLEGSAWRTGIDGLDKLEWARIDGLSMAPGEEEDGLSLAALLRNQVFTRPVDIGKPRSFGRLDEEIVYLVVAEHRPGYAQLDSQRQTELVQTLRNFSARQLSDQLLVYLEASATISSRSEPETALAY